MFRMVLSSSQQVAQFRRNEQGVQFIEAALVLPILLLLLAASAEFGRYFYVSATLSRTTRTAVRYVSSHTFKGTTNSDNAEAINLALCGSTAACGSGTEILSGLTVNHFQISTNGGTKYFPTTVTVQVNYTYKPIFPLGNFAQGLSWSNVPVKPRTTMRFTLSN